MLSTMANWLFGCSHRQTSFPITLRDGGGSRRHPKSTETYIVCLDCGRHFAYDWEHMRVARGPAEGAEGVPAERGLRSTPLFPARNRLVQRLVHHN